jgi:uncharacterized membrane protein YkoI
MKLKSKGTVIATTAIAALAAGGVAIAGASGDDDETDRPIRGPEVQRASAAALAATGGGKVTETEVGDEEGAYEVEVTRADGSQVDVHLDKHFTVLNSVLDDDDAGEDDAAGDD